MRLRYIVKTFYNWCRQLTNHCLIQCWTRSKLSYGVARPQYVNRIHIPWSRGFVRSSDDVLSGIEASTDRRDLLHRLLFFLHSTWLRVFRLCFQRYNVSFTETTLWPVGSESYQCRHNRFPEHHSLPSYRPGNHGDHYDAITERKLVMLTTLW